MYTGISGVPVVFLYDVLLDINEMLSIVRDSTLAVCYIDVVVIATVAGLQVE